MDIDELLKKHQNKVLLHVRRLVPEADAEDVMQNVLIGIWKAYDGFAALASFEHWVEAITHNQIVDYYRKRSRYMARLAKLKTTVIAKPTYNDFEVHDLLQKLPKSYGNILWKQYVEGSNLSEIAEEENLSYDTARGRSRRGIEYIRSHDLTRL